MGRANSLEKTLMLGKIEDKRRRGRQRMRWLDSTTDSMGLCCACAQSLQSCQTLCDPIDCSLLGSSVHGDSQGDTGVGCHALPPGDLPDWEIKPTSLKSPALADGFFTLVPQYNPTIPFWVHTKMKWKQGLEQIFVCLYKEQYYSQKPKDGNNPSV